MKLGGLNTLVPFVFVKIQVAKQRAGRDYERMHILIPYHIAESLRLQNSQRMYISCVSARKIRLVPERIYADDMPVTITQFVTKRTPKESYISTKFVIPRKLADAMNLKKGDDMQMTEQKRGIMISL